MLGDEVAALGEANDSSKNEKRARGMNGRVDGLG